MAADGAVAQQRVRVGTGPLAHVFEVGLHVVHIHHGQARQRHDIGQSLAAAEACGHAEEGAGPLQFLAARGPVGLGNLAHIGILADQRRHSTEGAGLRLPRGIGGE